MHHHPERLHFIDALRGFALFGVCWANLQVFSGTALMTEEARREAFPSAASHIASWIEAFAIENKFMGLFSILFGISFWLFLNSVSARGKPATKLFYRRVAWLFVIGAAHGWLLWAFDILRFYALWALVLPLFARAHPRTVLIASMIAGVIAPAVITGSISWLQLAHDSAGWDPEAEALRAFAHGSYVDMLSANWRYDWYLSSSPSQAAYQIAIPGHFLLGLYLARTLDFGNLASHRQLLIRVLQCGTIVGVAGSTVFANDLLQGEGGFLLPLARRALIEAGQFGMSITYASGLALLYMHQRFGRAVSRLAPIGRVALTAYLSQTLFAVWLFYGWPQGPALMGTVSPAMLLLILLAEYAAQLALARWWLTRFRFGPAEWVWRSLTYGEWAPMRSSAGRE